jgi:hypothetical protein
MRVSSITPEADYGYALQKRFLEDLLITLPQNQRMRLTGGHT